MNKMSHRLNSAGADVRCPNCNASHQPLEHNTRDGVYASTCLSCGHFFKFRASPVPKSSVTFSVNGKQYTVNNTRRASLSLMDFVRDELRLTGTKWMCKQGGCGICVVTARHYDRIAKRDVTIAINSCLCPVFACDGWSFTTTEGLGSSRQGFHPIQDRIAEHNGSQCGFCTPGMVMSMHSYLAEHPQPSKADVENVFDGNICRCTGYRSILDAMKTFAVENPSDIEDLDKMSLCRNCPQRSAPVASPVHVVTSTSMWVKVTSLAELYQTLQQVQNQAYTLVFGHTGNGVYYVGSYEVYIDIRDVPELFTSSLQEPVSIGASVTLSNLAAMMTSLGALPGYEYLTEFVGLIGNVAHLPVRNAGCWAGNIMLKHAHPEFPSDIFTFLEAIGACLNIGSSNGDVEAYSLADFLGVDMKGKVILRMNLPKMDSKDYVKVKKVKPRAQNAHSYITGAFRFRIDKSKNYLVVNKPAMVYGAISNTFIHAAKTEQFLEGKSLSDPAVLKGALTTLQSELITSNDPVMPSGEYRSKVAMALFYKFVLGVCEAVVGDVYKSGADNLTRPVSSGKQTFGTKRPEWPVTEPIPKLSGKLQASGEAQYTLDIPNAEGQLFASFVTASEGNATISSIDASAALNMPGVVAFLSAKDIPGENNFMKQNNYRGVEEVFCSGQVLYHGQAIGIIVADSAHHASSACYAVKVTYTNKQPPILTIQDAIDKKSFFPKPANDIVAGDADAAIRASDKVVTGETLMGTQYPYTMETQGTMCVPTEEGGVEVYAGTQWMDGCQQAVATVLGINNSKVRVKVKRLGGAYGVKITRNSQISAACALAAQVTNKPVRIHMPIWTNMSMVGKRLTYLAKYTVGVTNDGLLNGIRMTYYSDAGCSENESSTGIAMLFADSAYYCQNWHLDSVSVKTNTPSNTLVRAPGCMQAIFIIDTIMDHIARELGKDPAAVRGLNLYQKGQMNHTGQPLPYCNIREMYANLSQSADFTNRQAAVQAFNQANRWKKRGLAIMPMKWGIFHKGRKHNVYVTIFHGDGSISIAHGGVEIGQGINTKVAQVCAHELGIPMDIISIVPADTVSNANSFSTGASVTSELCCLGVIHCCQKLRERMAPIRDQMKPPFTWAQLVENCYAAGVDLTARYMTNPKPIGTNMFQYCVYATGCSEVELDVLTGENQIVRTDILYDCGDSSNPAIDIGQAEGAFVMGVGYCLTERTVYDPNTGKNLTNSTWEYKPPSSKDIPIDFRISFLQNAPNPTGVLGSKTVGEPPLTLSHSVLMALKSAIYAVHADQGDNSHFRLDIPATVDKTFLASKVDPSQFVLN